MTTSQKYANAPITEAIIALGIAPLVSINVLDSVALQCAVEYPKRERIFQAVGKFEVQPDGDASATAKQDHTGFKLSSEDGRFILQLQVTGFSLSRLSPYVGWESFLAEARRLWKIYKDTAGFGAVNRQAVRYINRIDIPGEEAEMSRYFRTSPNLSPDIRNPLESFFMQLRVPQPDISATAIINQATITPSRESVVSVVLDIDLFQTENLPSDEDGIWTSFETLRVRKNSIFEACITDDSRRLFQ